MTQVKKGISSRLSPDGVRIIQIHYTADPLKDPATPEGKAWIKRELQGYRGMDDPRWRKEMEIDFGAHGGQLLFPFLFHNEGTIFVPPHSVRGFNLIGGLDYGTRNPSAFEVLAVDYDDDVSVCYEYYEPPRGRDEDPELFRTRKGYKVLSAAIKRCPHFKDLQIIYADPSLWNKTQETKSGLKSVADLFAQEGIYLSPGQKGGDFACYERLSSHYWEDPQKPRLKIFNTCTWLWWELQRLRFMDFTEAVQISRNLSEKIVDKDNHAWDGIKYPLMQMPFAPKKKGPPKSYHDKRIEALTRPVGEPGNIVDYYHLKHRPRELARTMKIGGVEKTYDDAGLPGHGEPADDSMVETIK